MEEDDGLVQLDGDGTSKKSTGRPVRLVRRRKDAPKDVTHEPSTTGSPSLALQMPTKTQTSLSSPEKNEEKASPIGNSPNKDSKTPIPPGGIPPVEKLFTNFLAQKMAIIEQEHQTRSTDDVEAALAALAEEEQDHPRSTVDAGAKVAPMAQEEQDKCETLSKVVKEDEGDMFVSQDNRSVESEGLEKLDGTSSDSDHEQQTGKPKSKKKKKKEHKKSKKKDKDSEKNDKDKCEKDHRQKHKHKKKHKHKHKHKSDNQSRSRSRSYSRSQSRSRSSSQCKDKSDYTSKRRMDNHQDQKEKKLDLKISVGGTDKRKVEARLSDSVEDAHANKVDKTGWEKDEALSRLHFKSSDKEKPLSHEKRECRSHKRSGSQNNDRINNSKSGRKLGPEDCTGVGVVKSRDPEKKLDTKEQEKCTKKKSKERDGKRNSVSDEYVKQKKLQSVDSNGSQEDCSSELSGKALHAISCSHVSLKPSEESVKEVRQVFAGRVSKWDIKGPVPKPDTLGQAVDMPKPVVHSSGVVKSTSKWDVKEKKPTVSTASKWDMNQRTVWIDSGVGVKLDNKKVDDSQPVDTPKQIKLEDIELPKASPNPFPKKEKVSDIKLPTSFDEEHVEKPKRIFRKSAEQSASWQERLSESVNNIHKVFEIVEGVGLKVPVSHRKGDCDTSSPTFGTAEKVDELQHSKEKVDLKLAGSISSGEEKTGGTPPAPKKATLKLGIKISETSTALIQSGVKVENDPKKMNREEGEITDSESDSEEESSSEEEEGEEEEGGNTIEDGEEGELSDSESSENKSQKSKKKKKKHKREKHKKKKKKHKDHGGSSKRKNSSARSKTPKKRKHSRSRSRSRSRSGSFDKTRGVWRTRSRSKERTFRSRSRSPSRERHRSRSRERLRSGWVTRRRFGPRRSRSRSRERRTSPEDLRLKIDKAKLREIAIANAYANMKTGAGPKLSMKPDELAAFKAGGKSVEELTDFCKKISEKEADDSDDSGINQPMGNSDDEDGPFIHHPFKVRDPGTAIVMNIRNAKQLPIMTPAEKAAANSTLRLQFPVSSGSQHRDQETWVPVEKPKVEATTAKKAEPEEKGKKKEPEAKEAPAVVAQPAPTADKVFPDPPIDPINIGQVVSERLSAMRRLQENPNDVQATMQMYKANQAMSQWAQSKQLPGQFTGSTGANVLTVQELSGTDPRNQAWVKKDTLIRAQPVKPGIGMFLLQKMGWKEGEGLGKKKEGSLEPLMLEFKTDRKGLHANEESGKKLNYAPVRDLSGKHPVSALVELCNKRRWGSPEFILVNETGPDHKKHFIFKVQVNGMEYQPSTASSNKKHAKAQAATVCLQEFGLIPRDNNAAPAQ